MKEEISKELLKQARNAFETACTLHDDQRLEVFLDNDKAKISDILEENDEIVYTPNKILCYQVYGHNFLEDEIAAWIDYARVIPTPSDDAPLPEPTDIEKSVRELEQQLALAKQVQNSQISSYEIFANLPADLLGVIEQQIIEYWWEAQEEENAKKLAMAQIEDALKEYYLKK
jgi:hypothetical protein